MITYLSGTLIEKKPTEALVDVGGVGYAVLIPTSTFERLPAVGTQTKILTHHHVREAEETLFGFATSDERDVFRALTKVSGVGPKLALAALSAMPPDELRQYVVSGDISLLTRIPGVGRKTAERMIVELRDKLVPTAASIVEGSSKTSSASPSLPVARMDAILALEALGMSRGAAEKAVAQAMKASPTAVSAEELIRLALRS